MKLFPNCFLKPFLLTLTFLLAACSTPSPRVNDSVDAASPDMISQAVLAQNLQLLIGKVSESQAIPPAFVESGFSDTKTIPSIRKLVLPPSGTFKKNWAVYRQRFVEPIRLKAGKAFWEQNQAYLSQIEQDSGVPAEVIVAIIGIETIYGRQTGNFRVKDVLSTLAFNYPDTPNKAVREQLFKDEIKSLILLCWTQAGGKLPANNASQNVNPELFKQCVNQNSSYAGAIGLPQFMPSSIRAYAVDGDGDGQIDLRQSSRDAIASVANFLKQQGWQPGMPIYFAIPQSTFAQASALADGEPQLKYSVQELIEKGILTPQQGDLQAGGVSPQSKALIVDLPYADQDGTDKVRYVVGLNNFLTIVQYNRSYFYAQSVAEFAEALGYKNQSVITANLSALPSAKQSTNSKKKKALHKKATKASVN